MYLSSGVVAKCARECEKQQVGPREVGYLVNALGEAIAHYNIGDPIDLEFIRILGACVEPNKNRAGAFRHTPVTFNGEGIGVQANTAPHADIERLIGNWCNIVNEYLTNPNTNWDIALTKEMIREFLWVHPFKDGNGRVAFVLYNFLCGFKKFYREHTLIFVYPLPEFDWMN